MRRLLLNLFCSAGIAVLLSTTGAMAAGVAEAQQQQARVTGQVTDTGGQPLAGVTVIVEGGTAAQITDVQGRYSIQPPQGGGGTSLGFSLVGYVSQSVPVGGRTVVDVTLQEDSATIEGVVVTAMGITREQRTLGYAMTQVSGEEIAKANVVNPIQGLQGKVAGVQIDMGAGGPQSSQRIVIRGNTSLSGNNQPIFIVDGIIIDNEVTKTGDKADRDFGNELKSLNADDFETVSILKGAAATALYGSRASNGVILITTKKGEKRQGLGISFSQTLQWENVYRYPRFQNEYGMGTSPLWATNSDGTQNRNISATSYNWGPKYDGKAYTVGDYNGVWQPYPNNLDPLFQNGTYRNTNVAIQGGTDKSTFRLSYSNMKDVGLSPNNDMARNNIMFKASQEISKLLTAEASFTYTEVSSRNPTYQGGDNSPLYDFAWAVPRDYDTQYWMKNYWSANHDGYNNTDPFGYTNRLFEFFENNQIQDEVIYRGYAKLNFTFTPWLKLAVSADMNNNYTKRQSKTLATGYEKYTGAGYSLNENKKVQYRLNGMLSANHTFGEFNLGAYVGAESYNETQSYHNSNTNNGLRVPGLFELYNSVSPATTDALSINREKTVNSVFGALNADWRNQLYLEVTARNDWSSSMQYSNGSGNVSYFYPSVNLSWLVSESFRDRLPSAISFLKVRGSYAIVGKDCDVYLITDPASYQYSNVYNDAKWSNGNFAYYNFANANMGMWNLKPEKQHAIEFGADLKLFNDRLGVDFAWYKTNTRNQIITLPMSSETGVSNRIINAGNIQNQGIELMITGTPIQTQDWRWDLSLNFTRNRNRIIELANGIQNYQLPGGNALDVSAWATVGGSYGDIYTSHSYRRDKNGNKLLNASGAWLRSAESTKIGELQPDFLGGMSSTLTWKSLSLGFTLDARFGGDIFSSTYNYGTLNGKFQSSLKYRTEGLAREIETDPVKGTTTTIYDGMIPYGVFEEGAKLTLEDNSVVELGGMTYQEAYEKGYVKPLSAFQYFYNGHSWGSGILDKGIMDCTWVSLRDISLSWSVPEKWTSKAFLHNVMLSLNVRNVCYLYNSLPDGIYPDALINNYSSQFREGGGRPYSRRYGFTVSLNF